MRLGLTDEQRQLRAAFRDFFSNKAGAAVARAAEPSGFDRKLWLGLADIGATEMTTEDGGRATLAEMVLLVEEAGRWIAPVPLAEHLAATTLFTPPTEQSLVVLAPVPGTAGTARAVPGGAVADMVIALDDDELVAVAPAGSAVPLPNLAALPLADVNLSMGERTVLAKGDQARHRYQHARQVWQVLTAAMLVGASRAALDLARGYVMERTQFGVPIGSFQALQQQLADLPGRIDGAELLVAKAAWAVDDAPAPVIDLVHNEIDDAAALAAMAYLFAADGARRATRTSLQCHGGYGYSVEYDIQLYYRRVRGWAALGGPRPAFTRELATRLGLVN